MFLVMFLIAGVSAGNVKTQPQPQQVQTQPNQDPYCNQYNADGTCAKCAYRYYFSKDNKCCVQVSDYCATWDSKTGACLTCFPSYGTPVNGVCSSTPVADTTVTVGSETCDPNCQNHDDNRVCIKCYTGYKLDSSNTCAQIFVAVPPPVIDNCAEWGYLDAKGKWWTKFVAGCKKLCKACNAGYYLNSAYACVTLPANCKAADVNGKCTDCVSGYTVNEKGNCEKVQVTAPPADKNCAQYGYVDAKGKIYTKFVYGCKKVCVKCVVGCYLDNKYFCIALPKYCDACDVYGKCTTCSAGYELVNGACQAIKVTVPADNCAKYGYVDAKGKWYTYLAKGCKKVCKECADGYKLNDGACVAIVAEVDSNDDNPYCQERDEDGKCCACAYRTYLNEDCICTPVSDLCNEWDDLTGCCTSCYAGYKLVNGECCLA